MWQLLQARLRTVLRLDGVGVAPPPTPLDIATRYQGLKATSSAITDYYKSRGAEAPSQAEAAKDLLALSADKDLQGPEVAKVKAILATVQSGKPLSDADLKALTAVVERLQAKLAGDQGDMITDAATPAATLVQLATSGVTPQIQSDARDALVFKLGASADPAELAQAADALATAGAMLDPARSTIASNEHATAETLARLLDGTHGDQVEMAVIANGKAGTATLQQLAVGGQSDAVKAAATEALTARAKASQDPAELARLVTPIPPSNATIESVQMAVAANPRATAEVLGKLLSGSLTDKVEVAAARNPNISAEDRAKLAAGGSTQEVKETALAHTPGADRDALLKLAESGVNPEIKSTAAKALQMRGPELLARFTELDKGYTSGKEYAEMRKLAAAADPETRAKMIAQLMDGYTSGDAEACIRDIVKDARGPADKPPSVDFKIMAAHLDLNEVYGELDGTNRTEVKGWVSSGAKYMNPTMAKDTSTELGKLVAADPAKPPRVTEGDRDALVNSVAVGGVIGRVAAEEAAKAMVAMPQADYDKFRKLLDKADDDTEKALLMKALAAGRSIDDISAFAAKIHTMTPAEMIDKCTLADTDSDAIDEGVRQQYTHACGPTTVEALEGEADPIYALAMREGNTNVTGLDAEVGNVAMAADQKAKLQTATPGYAAGVAVSRSDPTAAGGGVGRFVADQLNGISAKTHCTFTTNYISPAPWNPAMTTTQAINAMDTALRQGMPVPLIVGPNNTSTSHYVLATNARGASPDREFQVHDPWDGTTVWIKESDLKNGTITPPLAGHTTLSGIEVPTRQ